MKSDLKIVRYTKGNEISFETICNLIHDFNEERSYENPIYIGNMIKLLFNKYRFIVMHNNKPIGFMLAGTEEKYQDDIIFIDFCVKNEYRIPYVLELNELFYSAVDYIKKHEDGFVVYKKGTSQVVLFDSKHKQYIGDDCYLLKGDLEEFKFKHPKGIKKINQIIGTKPKYGKKNVRNKNGNNN